MSFTDPDTTEHASDCASCGNTRGAIIDFEGGPFDRSPIWGPCPVCNPDGRLLPDGRVLPARADTATPTPLT